MPEGNILHRIARVHGQWLVGRSFTADSPQGRFPAGCGSPPLHLAGPQACELLSHEDAAELRSRLGPDPLRPDASPSRALEALRKGRIPLAAALLDQGRIAGVGNILRAEALFLARLPPLRPASELRIAEFERLWEALRLLMEDAARDGRIVTPHAPPAPWETPGKRREDRFSVYDREGQPCPRCATPLSRVTLAGRGLFFCPGCQTPHEHTASVARRKEMEHAPRK
ncbi:MAG TPA: zinc finger domain-containing protein [Archangium sp.]|uniref:Fpg/Nei family DNA glycosylase n=1 Tax=Archangium sp. TaxID=1872627 RepID=UPI002E31FBF0|nr:zinc finger domain-containing protein [Archangium sp.]HEX5747696.1 zinc finger domain-containing protein [Archangium sp.]